MVRAAAEGTMAIQGQASGEWLGATAAEGGGAGGGQSRAGIGERQLTEMLS